MVEKPVEWRRFEPVELKGPVAHSVSKGPVPLPYENPASTLREFERLLRENERLQAECAELRAHAAKSDTDAVRFQEDLDAARAELTRLQSEVDNLRSAMQNQAIPLPPPPHAQQEDGEPAPASPHRAAAEVVAGYLFAKPNERQVRLVEDALRARGIQSA